MLALLVVLATSRASMFVYVQSNVLHIEATRAVFEQSMPVLGWVQASTLSTNDRLFVAEMAATTADVSEATAKYLDFLEHGGDPKQAVLRLERLAAMQQWCTQRSKDAITLAALLMNEVYGWRVLGRICLVQGDSIAAISALRTAFALGPQAATAVELADALFGYAESVKHAQPDVANNYYSDIVTVLSGFALDALNAGTLYKLAWSQWQLNRFDDAIATYRRCVVLKQQQRDAFGCAMNLGYIYSAWLPPAGRNYEKSRLFFSLAETLIYDETSRDQVRAALGTLPR